MFELKGRELLPISFDNIHLLFIKTVRNGLKQLALTVYGGDKERVQKFLDSEPLPLPQSVQEAKDAGDEFAMTQQLPLDWVKKRPEITKLLCSTAEGEETLGKKVWRKLKHGT